MNTKQSVAAAIMLLVLVALLVLSGVLAELSVVVSLHPIYIVISICVVAAGAAAIYALKEKK